mgnify:CR=1 FL=1
MDEKLLGKCGFYCGACPSFIKGNCSSCFLEHKKGDCFSRDCVLEKGLRFCGECKEFPCETIIKKTKCTVLDKNWLLWKKSERK